MVDLSWYHNRRALVLGASGFIGRWVARGLAALDVDVHIGVRDPTHAAGLLRPYVEGAPIHAADAVDLTTINKLLDTLQPDIVFNLIGYGINRDERDEATAALVNAELPRQLCEYVAALDGTDWPGMRFVHVGSALEYGTASGDLREDTNPAPTTVYGRSKLAGTRSVFEVSKALRVPSVTARLFTVYGPGEHPNRLLPCLMRASIANTSIDLTDGMQHRDFGYVEDIATGLIGLGSTPGDAGAIVNVATGTLQTVRRFVEVSAKVLGLSARQLKFGALPTRPEEMSHESVNLNRLRQRLNWYPSPSIADGVRRALAFENRMGQ